MDALSRVIAAARRRMRWQRTMETAAGGAIATSVLATLIIYAHRMAWLEAGPMWVMLGGVGALFAAAMAMAWSRPLRDAEAARRLDLASGYPDRLRNAVVFTDALAQPGANAIDGETHAMMNAAVADGQAAATATEPQRTLPYTMPRHGRAAIGFVAAALVLASLAPPSIDRSPHLTAAQPPHAPPGAEVVLKGLRLGEGDTANRVTVGGEPATILEWSDDTVLVKLATGTPLGIAAIELATPAGRATGIAIEIVDPKDATYFKEDAVVLSPAEREYISGIIARLKQIADEQQAPALAGFAKAIEDMVAATERGEISKEALLDALRQAEAQLQGGAEPSPGDIDKALAETGAALAKTSLTKALGESLRQGDLTAAKREFEALADQLDSDALTEPQKDALAKALDDAAKAFSKKEQADAKAKEDELQKAKEAVRRLQKEKEEAKPPRAQAETERRLAKAKRELERLEKEQAARDSSEQRRALKRLHKDMEKVAESLAQRDQQASQDGKDGQQDGKDGQQDGKSAASRKLREAARETGRVDQDKRRQAAAQKATSSMDDLKEALRRAKQRGNKSPSNPFAKNESEFGRRAAAARRRGGQSGTGQGGQAGAGSGQPGQGQTAQGGAGQGGQGQTPGGSDYGDGHDPNFAGAPTSVTGDTKDQDLQGLHGKGPSRRETILSAAQKGFAGVAYKSVYTDYETIVEEVMRSENVPSAYRHYIKRYFDSIKPR